MTNVSVIPARGGSKRILKKNIKIFTLFIRKVVANTRNKASFFDIVVNERYFFGFRQ